MPYVRTTEPGRVFDSTLDDVPLIDNSGPLVADADIAALYSIANTVGVPLESSGFPYTSDFPNLIPFEGSISVWSDRWGAWIPTRVSDAFVEDLDIFGDSLRASDFHDGPMGVDTRDADGNVIAQNDGTQAIVNSIAACILNGKKFVILEATPDKIGITGRVSWPRGVMPRGEGASKTTTNPGVWFKALTSDAGFDIGDAVSSVQDGGIFGGFGFDAAGLAYQPIHFRRISQGFCAPIFVQATAANGVPQATNDAQGNSSPLNDMTWHRNNAGVLLDFCQNTTFWLNISNTLGNGIVFDRGTGGHTIYLEAADFGPANVGDPGTGAFGIVCQQSVDGSADPYPSPTNIFVKGWGGVERGNVGAGGNINVLGGSFSFEDGFLADGELNLVAPRAVIRLRSMTVAGKGTTPTLRVGQVTSAGGKNIGTAIDIGKNGTVVLTRRGVWRGYRYFAKIADGGTLIEQVEQQFTAVEELFDPSGTADYSTAHKMPAGAGLVVHRPNPTWSAYRAGVVQQSVLVDVTSGSPTVTVTGGGTFFTSSHVGGQIKVGMAGASGIAPSPASDFTGTILSVAGDGKSAQLTVAAYPSQTLVGAYGSVTEAFDRWALTVAGDLQVGPGNVAPSTVIAASQWTVIASSAPIPPIRKLVADESGANSSSVDATTWISDNKLFYAMPANAGYDFLFEINYDGSTTGDIKVGLVFPTLSNATWSCLGLATGASGTAAPLLSSGNAIGGSQAAGALGVGTTTSLRMWGVVETGNNAGTFGLRYMQNLLDAANPTKVRQRSLLKLNRLY